VVRGGGRDRTGGRLVRTRTFLVGLVAAAILAVAGAAGWSWLRTLTETAAAPQSDPSEVVHDYLAAWEVGDHAAMAALVREPLDDFVARHAQLREGLGVIDLALTAGTLVEEVDGRVRVPVTVAARIDDDLDPMTWQVELRAIRERGTWAVWWSPASVHPQLREGWEFAVEREPVVRSPILAHDGTPLATEGNRVTFGFEPSQVRDPDALVAAFEAAVPGSGERARREVERGNLRDGWFYPVVSVSSSREQAAWSRLRGTPGVLRRTVDGRTLFDDHFAQHVVGVLAEATAEQLEELGDDGEPGMILAQYGLERALDHQLVGSDLVRAGLRDTSGDTLRVVIWEGQVDPSAAVRTTIDIDVQRAVEAALEGVTGEVGIVVVDRDGAVRGAASRPLGSYNRAFAGRYPPGSTFKIVTAEALLAAGRSPDEIVACPPTAIIGGLQVTNAGGFDGGTLTLTEAFARSCNTTFATLGAALGPDLLTAAARRFGFGVEPEVVLDAFGGSFPPPADTAEAGAAAFGQGRVEASVLHLASIAAAAENGEWHRPYLLADEPPGESVPLAAGTAEALRSMLRAAVVSGTGARAAVDGVEVGGKTGTAQAAGGVEHAWFAGTWNGYGFAVLVEGGGAGSQAAAPIAASLVRHLAGVADSVGDDQDAGGAGDSTDEHPPDDTDTDDDDGG
jgi:cell division protein FtsI/penicillin-binding protein 2